MGCDVAIAVTQAQLQMVRGQFEQALATLIPQRYLPTRPIEPPGGLPGRWWETDLGVVCVYRVARYVTFVSGPDLDTLADVVEALP